MSVSHFITVFSHVPILVAAVYALLVYKTLDKRFRIFSWYIFSTSFLQFISLALGLLSVNNMPVLHILVPLNYFLLGVFYNSLLGDFIGRKIINVSIGLFVAFSVFNSVFVQHLQSINTYALTVQSALLLILTIGTYMLFIGHPKEWVRREQYLSLQWINSGLFIYYQSSLLLFCFGKTIMKEMPVLLSRYTWALHAVFSIIMNVCFIIALWKRPKT